MKIGHLQVKLDHERCHNCYNLLKDFFGLEMGREKKKFNEMHTH
jgi:hypothetical protein